MKQKGLKRKKKKEPIEDDGHTIVNMNVEGFSWYMPGAAEERKKKEERDQPTKREMWALILAAYKAYLPYFVAMIVGFGLAFLIAALWLR